MKLTRSAALIAAGAALPAAVSAQPPEPERCAGQAVGSSCWMEIDNRPGCYLWNDSLAEEETVTWNGACVDSLASSFGAVEWRYLNADGEEDSHRGAGEYVDGKEHGDWTLRAAGGDVQEGPYMDGKRHGDWTERRADGDVQEGPYVDGKKHGDWTERNAIGHVQEGPYMDGERHGDWTMRRADGSVSEATYVDARRHSDWTAVSAPASTTSRTAPRGRCLIPRIPRSPKP